MSHAPTRGRSPLTRDPDRRSPRRGALAALGIAALSVLSVLSGCTSNPSAGGGPITAGTGPSVPTSTSAHSGSGDAAPTTAAASSSAGRPTATPSRSSSSAPATVTPTTGPPANPHLPRCTAAELRISALRGSGAQQQQYATVYLTASGSRACWLVGYASVSLRLGGAALGATARPAGTDQPAYLLARGATALALVHGPSTCEAGVSDAMRISAPGATAFTDAVVPMRGCPLIVDAFTPSTPH